MTQSKIFFGIWESTMFLLNLLGTQIILGFSRLVNEAVGPAGWLLILYVSCIALLGFAMISKLYRKFEGLDLIDVGEYTAGAFGRIITGLLIFVYSIFIITIILREFAEDMKVIILPQTPISFVTMFFLTGMILGAYKGIEAIVRLNSIAMPVIILGFFIITVAVAPYFEVSNLLPVLGKGANQIFVKGFNKVSFFGAIINLYLIYPFIRTRKNFNRIGYTSHIVASLFYLWAALSYSLVFPYPVSTEKFLPIYELARLINYGRFFQRIESVFVFIWAASALLFLSGGFYLILNIFKKTFKLDYYHPLIFPFAAIIFTMSLLPPNLMTAVSLESTYIRNYAWLFILILPILLLIMANIKKGRSKGGIKR